MPNVPGTPGDDILYGTEDDDTISGIGGNDHLFGFGGNDSLDGGDGSDILDGGTGADTMTGGIGDDFYVVDNAGDLVVEDAGAGSDLVFTTIDYTLPANVERLAVYSRASTFAVNLTGNAGDNELTGNDGANFIDGGAGRDVMRGAKGDDQYVVTLQGVVSTSFQPNGAQISLGYTYLNCSQRDIVNEHAGEGTDTIWVPFTSSASAHNVIDYTLIAEPSFTAISHIERLGVYDRFSTYAVNLQGDFASNELLGNDGQNFLDGYGGADVMTGYGGDDLYFVDDTGDVVVEVAGGGHDTVYLARGRATLNIASYTLPDQVEQLLAYAGGVALNGNALDNQIVGNGAANVIDGGIGADLMRGLTGDDTYVVDNVGDIVTESAGEGSDTVLTAIDYFLPESVERLQVNGAASTFAINLTGNGSANDIVGNDGANIIDGRTGVDMMHGRGGDDIYVVDNAGDVVDEAANGGFDTVYVAGLSYTLGANVDRLIAYNAAGTEAINLTGNGLDNEIKGNAGANLIDGKFGIDILQGMGGADTFAFTSQLVGADNADQIVDFETGLDKIALDDAIFTLLAPGALSASAFQVGAGAQDADDRIIYDAATGKLYYDTDGNGAAEQIHFATLHEGLALAASDFTVI